MRINDNNTFVNIWKCILKMFFCLKKINISLFYFIILQNFFNLSLPIFMYIFRTSVTLAALQITLLGGTFIFIQAIVEIFNNFFAIMSDFFSNVFITRKTIIQVTNIDFPNTELSDENSFKKVSQSNSYSTNKNIRSEGNHS